MCVWTDRSASNRNVVDRLARLEPVTVATVGLSDTVLVLLLITLVALAVVLNRIVHVVWVAQAVRLTMRLRRNDTRTVVGSVVGLVLWWGLSEHRARLRTLHSTWRSLTGGSTTSVGGQTALALSNLAHDTTTVRSLADGWQNRTHRLNEVHAQLGGGELKCRLNNVVSIRVSHKLLKLLDVQQLLNHHALDVWLSATDALLDNVGTKLLLGQLADLALEALAHGCSKGGIVEIEDVLNHVVAKWILYKVEAVGSDLADEIDLLEPDSVIDAALKNTATMAVGTNSNAVLAYSIEDELSLRRFEVVQALLDDVVTIQILDEIHDLSRQCSNDHLSLRKN